MTTRSRTGRFGRGVIVAMILTLLPATAAPAAAATSATSAPVTIGLATSGPDPVRAVVPPGETVVWRNDGTAADHVIGEGGALDSGDIPAGGAFVAALDVPGIYPYDTVGGRGWLVVGDQDTTHLVGPGDGSATDAVPDLPFPDRPAGDMATHPDLLIEASTSRALVGFTDAATIDQANAALDAAGVMIVGGIADFGIVLVTLTTPPATGDFGPLDAALDSLRSDPAIEFAALDMDRRSTRFRHPSASPSATTSRGLGAADGTETGLGMGYNWDLEADRFPQAWNLKEAIERTNPSVRTVVADSGFVDEPPGPLDRGARRCARPLLEGWDCTKNYGAGVGDDGHRRGGPRDERRRDHRRGPRAHEHGHPRRGRCRRRQPGRGPRGRPRHQHGGVHRRVWPRRRRST